MVLIFYNKSDAEAANLEASEKESLPTVTNGTQKVALVQKHPNKDLYALDLSLYSGREWLQEVKSKADEVVSELPKDWFEE